MKSRNFRCISVEYGIAQLDALKIANGEVSRGKQRSYLRYWKQIEQIQIKVK